MSDFSVTSKPTPSVVSRVNIGKETYTKMSDGSVVRYSPNAKHLPGEVTRFENEKDADVFIKMAINKEAEKGDLVVKPKAGIGKKLATSFASLIIPGFGQAINGQWGKALGFFVGVGVSDAIGFVLGGPIGAGIAHAVVNVLNIVDAYRNAN